MSDYEEKIRRSIDNAESLPAKFDFSIAKYFWQSGPIMSQSKNTVPRFLRKIPILKSFSENELRVLCKYLHHRSFSDGERIFSQGNAGVGFYLIYSGHVDILDDSDVGEKGGQTLAILERFDFFGEMALLQNRSERTATAMARENCELIGIFKPDVEELLVDHPIIATKLIQIVAMIIANRLYAVSTEVKNLKHKVHHLEKSLGKTNA